MKYWYLKLFLVLTCLGYRISYAQQVQTTSYQNKDNTELNVSLFGKVKCLKQFSANPNAAPDTITYIFDDQGLPVQIVNKSEGLFYSIVGEKVFDFENGHLMTEKYFENNKLLFGTNLKYDISGNLIERSQYSNKKHRKEAVKPFFIETFQYDSSGLLKAYSKDNITGKIYKKIIYKYDDNGNKIEYGYCENYKGLRYSTGCNYIALSGYEYNANNQLTRKFDIAKWTPHNTDIYYQYDGNGNEIMVEGYYLTDIKVLGYRYVYQYDEYGNRIREEEKWGNYRVIDFEKYKYAIMQYDMSRNLVEQKFYAAGDFLVKIICFNYYYDNYGNWIRREKYEGKTESELFEIESDERKIEYYP